MSIKPKPEHQTSPYIPQEELSNDLVRGALAFDKTVLIGAFKSTWTGTGRPDTSFTGKGKVQSNSEKML